MDIKVLSVRSRYCPFPLNSQQFSEWDKDAANCERLLEIALKQGYRIIERWPSPDGNVLNVIMCREDKNPVDEAAL
jgi:hypothetical protein